MTAEAFCANCGAARPAGSAFCVQCGKAFGVPGPGSTPSAQGQTPGAGWVQPSGGTGNRAVLLVALIIGVVIVIGVAYYAIESQNVRDILTRVGQSV